jgi:hypothetical protein
VFKEYFLSKDQLIAKLVRESRNHAGNYHLFFLCPGIYYANMPRVNGFFGVKRVANGYVDSITINVVKKNTQKKNKGCQSC